MGGKYNFAVGSFYDLDLRKFLSGYSREVLTVIRSGRVTYFLS